MKKFQFKFESVETVRKRAEEKALRDLADARRAQARILEFKAGLEKALMQALERRERIGQGPASGADFQIENDFIAGTKQRLVQTEATLTRINRGLEKAMQTYLNARKQTRVIELLRERSYAEYRKERSKHLDREMNDMMVMRARMKEEGA